MILRKIRDFKKHQISLFFINFSTNITRNSVYSTTFSNIITNHSNNNTIPSNIITHHPPPPAPAVQVVPAATQLAHWVGGALGPEGPITTLLLVVTSLLLVVTTLLLLIMTRLLLLAIALLFLIT